MATNHSVEILSSCENNLSWCLCDVDPNKSLYIRMHVYPPIKYHFISLVVGIRMDSSVLKKKLEDEVRTGQCQLFYFIQFI
jgi:hypothetical protein